MEIKSDVSKANNLWVVMQLTVTLRQV